MLSEIDALRAAKLLTDQHGVQEAWRILTARAIDEQRAGQLDSRALTQQVLAALDKLTRGPAAGELKH